MIPESEISFDTPVVTMTGTESRISTASPVGGASFEHEPIPMAVTARSRALVNEVVSLFNFPLHEPAFIERYAKAETQVLLFDLSGKAGLDPLILHRQIQH